MSPDEAIEIVARHVIAHNVYFYTPEQWEQWPDLGEEDYRRVVDAARALAPFPDPTEYETAYALLSARAEKEA